MPRVCIPGASCSVADRAGSLMFSWAHVEGYPLRVQCEATARFLADALEGQERS